MENNDNNKRTPLHVEEGNVEENEQTSTYMHMNMHIVTALLKTWWREAAWPGMGLFGESYLLFSVGLIKPFWEILYPECFAYEVCSPQLLHSLTYAVVLGIICGMIVLGYLANSIGRRMGGITTASFMSAGAIGLALVSFCFANNPQILFRSMSVLFFIFGVGVGGEYPMSSSTAAEKAMGEMKKKLKLQLQREAARAKGTTLGADRHPARHLDVWGTIQDHSETCQNVYRGRAVQLVFLGQGIGILINSLCLVVLLLLFGQYGSDVVGGNYRPEALLAIWRIVYSIGAVVLTVLLVTRVAYLKESSVWADDRERRNKLDRTTIHTSDPQAIEQPHALASALSCISDLSTPSSVMVGNGDVSSLAEFTPIATVEDDLSATRECELWA